MKVDSHKKSPKLFLNTLWRERELIWCLTEREISMRYRGSILGWTWSIINPLLMLAVYTFVFSKVFKATWGPGQNGDTAIFAINLFAGLIVFNLFSECSLRSPGTILSNINYVKKIIFPVEILPVVTVAAAVFHACTGVAVLAIVQLLTLQEIPISIGWLPLVWAPLILGCLGISWILSALGVYLRDLGQIIGVFTNILMFISAVFYPLSSLPEKWRPIISLNPLVSIIEETRRVTVTGMAPNFWYIFLGSVAAMASCQIGYGLFQKARKGFADVL